MTGCGATGAATATKEDEGAGSDGFAACLAGSGATVASIGVSTAVNATFASDALLKTGATGAAGVGALELLSFGATALGSLPVCAIGITARGAGGIGVTTTVVKFGKSAMLRGCFTAVGEGSFGFAVVNGAGCGSAAGASAATATLSNVGGTPGPTCIVPGIVSDIGPSIDRIIASAICDGVAAVANGEGVVTCVAVTRSEPRNIPIMESNAG